TVCRVYATLQIRTDVLGSAVADVRNWAYALYDQISMFHFTMLLTFKVAPIPPTGQDVLTWKLYFERFDIAVNTVYDVCDVVAPIPPTGQDVLTWKLYFERFDIAVNTVYDVCDVDPQDEAASDETAALLYFDIKSFNEVLLPPECTQSVAEEMEQLMNRNFTDRKLVTVSGKLNGHQAIGNFWACIRNTLVCKQIWFCERPTWNIAESLVCDVPRQLNMLHQVATCLSCCDIRDIAIHARQTEQSPNQQQNNSNRFPIHCSYFYSSTYFIFLSHITAQDGVKKLWGYTIRTEMKSSFSSEDLKVQMGDPILKASFETRNDIIKRWLVGDASPKPLTICFERFSLHWALSYYEMHFEVHFEVEKIADKDPANFVLELAKIAKGPGSKGPFPVGTSYLNWLDTWKKLERKVFSKSPVRMISRACTRFEKVNTTVLQIEGSVLVANTSMKLNYERSNHITRSQLERLLKSPNSDVPPPISIQMSDFGWLAYSFAVQEVYYDLRHLSKEPGQSGASAMTAHLLNSLSTETDGFGVEKIEYCLLSRPPVQRLEHFVKVPLLLDGKSVAWKTPPAENSEEYLQIKQNVTKYLQKMVDAGNLRKVITAFQVGKLAKDALAFYYYDNVHVHLRLIYDALAVGQQLGLSGTITDLLNEAKIWLETEYSSALQKVPKSGIHLGEQEKSHFKEINELIYILIKKTTHKVQYILIKKTTHMVGENTPTAHDRVLATLGSSGVPEAPQVLVFPTSAVTPQSKTTVPTPTSTAKNDDLVTSVDSEESDTSPTRNLNIIEKPTVKMRYKIE
ncbi:hypothetical protein T265_13314, partial [Opisthorchis viverrini]